MTDSLQVFDKMSVSASLNPNHDPDGDSRSPRTGGLLGPTLGWFLRRIWCFPSNRSYLRNQLILLGWSLDVAHGTESISAGAGFSLQSAQEVQSVFITGPSDDRHIPTDLSHVGLRTFPGCTSECASNRQFCGSRMSSSTCSCLL